MSPCRLEKWKETFQAYTRPVISVKTCYEVRIPKIMISQVWHPK